MRKLFANGTILTMNDEQLQTEAVLVKDGLIEATGSLSELRALCGREKAQEIDLEHHTLLPAFVDGHSHILHCAQGLLFAQLSETRTFQEMLDALRTYIVQNRVAPGEWVIGTGYDPERLAEKAHPTRALLDELKDWPVLVTADSGHMGCLNGFALRLAGINASTPDPEGGKIGHGPDGEANGYLEEAAFTAVQRFIPPVTPQRLMEGLERAQRLYASYGVATAQEGLLHPEDYAFLKEADETGRLRLDVIGYADIRQRERFAHVQPNWGLRPGRFRVGGYKMFLDGSPQGRTAWLTKPYLPVEGQDPDYRGYPMMSLEEARHYVQIAADEKQQLLTHCNGDAAIDQLLDAHTLPCVTRNVIVHAQTMRADQLARAKTLGLMPSFFVAHVQRYGDQHIRNLGMERAAFISPVGSAERLGLRYTLHQDTPVMPPDMAGTVSCVMRRVTEAGVLLGPQERVDLIAALRGVTTYGAYQYFEEASKGAIKPGMRADLAVMEEDWLNMPPEQIAHSRAVATYKDGVELM